MTVVRLFQYATIFGMVAAVAGIFAYHEDWQRAYQEEFMLIGYFIAFGILLIAEGPDAE